jgi:hypothetical protein
MVQISAGRNQVQIKFGPIAILAASQANVQGDGGEFPDGGGAANA